MNKIAQIDVDGWNRYILGDYPFSTSDTVYLLTDHTWPPDLNGTVNAVDTTTYDIKSIPVGINPTYIFGDLSSSDFIYVASSGRETYGLEDVIGSISVINTVNNTMIRTIPVGINPTHIFGDLSSSDLIYVANSGSGTVSVINTTINKVIKNINVGDYPVFIYGEPDWNEIYVANSGSGTVSEIDNTTNEVTTEIPVGGSPGYIEGDLTGGKIFVANEYNGYDNGYVSVIDTASYNTPKNIKNITVGVRPNFLYGDVGYGTASRLLYVVNSGSNTVSVIDTVEGRDHGPKNIKNITVGDNPNFIYYDSSYGIYVANTGSDTISHISSTTYEIYENISVVDQPSSIYPVDDAIYVAGWGGVSIINSFTSKVVAGVTFDIKPLRGGQLICNGLNAPINRLFYVSSGTECLAKPNNGFEFGSWIQNLDNNATNIINISTQTDSILPALSDAFSDDPAATLTVNRFGNFTVYFNEAPPPVPEGVWIALFSILLGTFMPSIIRWINGWRQRRRFYEYMEKLSSKYRVKSRQGIEDEIAELYAKGKINDSQHKMLKDKVADQSSKLGSPL